MASKANGESCSAASKTVSAHAMGVSCTRVDASGHGNRGSFAQSAPLSSSRGPCRMTPMNRCICFYQRTNEKGKEEGEGCEVGGCEVGVCGDDVLCLLWPFFKICGVV